MKNIKSWIDELDQVSEERQLSRYDQLLLDAAEVQLLLGNLGAADSLINKINDYNIVGTFNVLKEKEEQKMKKVYISKIDYFDGENNQNFAYCIFDDKEQATEWIQNHRNLLEEDLYLFKKMEQVFYSTLSEEERNKYYLNLSDLARSFEEYYISPLGFDVAIDEYSYEIDEYEIGKEGIIESYYEFGEPVIDFDRVEQKLSEYEKQRRR